MRSTTSLIRSTRGAPRVGRRVRSRARRAAAVTRARANDDASSSASSSSSPSSPSSSVDEAKRAVVRAIAESRRLDGGMPTSSRAGRVMTSIERLETFPSSSSAGGRWTLAYGAKAAAAATGARRSTSNGMESLGVSDAVIQEIMRTMYGVFFKYAPWLAGSAETNRRGARNAQTVDVAAGVVRNEVELDLEGPTTTTTTTVCIGVDGEIRAEDALARDAVVTFTSFDVRARFGGESTSPTLTLPLPRPRGRLRTTFCDETMRVSRGGQGGVFVLTRLRDDATASSE